MTERSREGEEQVTMDVHRSGGVGSDPPVRTIPCLLRKSGQTSYGSGISRWTCARVSSVRTAATPSFCRIRHFDCWRRSSVTRQEVVTRDDLRGELWAHDTFVDFEHSLNAAIRRLREALGDSASAPRFIETLPRRGYRFIAPVERNGIESPASTPAPTPRMQPTPAGSMAERAAPREWFHRRSLTYGLAAVGVIVLSTVAARSLTLWRHEPTPVIAVLPLKNLSSEPDSEYFADGLTDEIIRNLSVIDGLEVRSGTSSFTFKNKPRNTHEVGTALQAGLIVEGSILREGHRVRINTRLVRVADDVPLWSGHFDRQLEDIFAIQDEISRSIVNELRLKLGRGQRRYTTDIQTYDLFLKARVLQARRAQNGRLASELFDQVVKKDPTFAPAYAGIASSYGYLSYVFPIEGAFGVPPEKADWIMRSAAFKALELDPLLADAHAAMGQVHAFDHEWTQAETSFRRALQLNPSLTSTYTDFALTTLLPEGKLDEAMRLLETATRADPLSLDVRRVLVHVQINAGLYDRAIEQLRSCACGRSHVPLRRGVACPRPAAQRTGHGGYCRDGATGCRCRGVSRLRVRGQRPPGRGRGARRPKPRLSTAAGDDLRGTRRQGPRVRSAREACRHQPTPYGSLPDASGACQPSRRSPDGCASHEARAPLALRFRVRISPFRSDRQLFGLDLSCWSRRFFCSSQLAEPTSCARVGALPIIAGNPPDARTR